MTKYEFDVVLYLLSKLRRYGSEITKFPVMKLKYFVIATQ